MGKPSINLQGSRMFIFIIFFVLIDAPSIGCDPKILAEINRTARDSSIRGGSNEERFTFQIPSEATVFAADKFLPIEPRKRRADFLKGREDDNGLTMTEAFKNTLTDYEWNWIEAHNKGLQEIHNWLKAKYPKAEEINVALYPSSGSDGQLVPTIFPNVTISISVSDGSFIVPKKGLCKYRVEGRAPHLHFTDEEKPGFAQRLLGSLHRSVPKFRLLRITTFTTAEPKLVYVKGNGGWGSDNTKIRVKPSHHAIIEYDTGEGTEIRRHVHIDTWITNDYRSSWWFLEIDKLKPRAIVLKGSGDSSYGWDRKGSEDYNQFSDALLGWAKQNHGLLIEGRRNLARDAWEFSGNTVLPGATPEVITAVPYGYGNEIKIHDFP